MALRWTLCLSIGSDIATSIIDHSGRSAQAALLMCSRHRAVGIRARWRGFERQLSCLINSNWPIIRTAATITCDCLSCAMCTLLLAIFQLLCVPLANTGHTWALYKSILYFALLFLQKRNRLNSVLLRVLDNAVKCEHRVGLSNVCRNKFKQM